MKEVIRWVEDYEEIDKGRLLIRCKDCKHRDPEDKKCDCGHDIQWQLPREDDWYCADAERKKTMDELKPCPFCGGRVIIGRGIDGEITGILCRSCHAMVKWDIHMKPHETFGENEAKWADKWNQRWRG